jgi:hypothetical protein
MTAMHLAAGAGKAGVIKLLLDAGEKCNNLLHIQYVCTVCTMCSPKSTVT